MSNLQFVLNDEIKSFDLHQFAYLFLFKNFNFENDNILSFTANLEFVSHMHFETKVIIVLF